MSSSIRSATGTLSTVEQDSSRLVLPVNTNPDPRGSFQKRWDVVVRKPASITKELVDVQHLLQNQVATIDKIQRALKWRTASLSELKSYAEQLARYDGELTSSKEKLSGHAGVHQSVAVLMQRRDQAMLLSLLEKMELELAFAKKSVKRLLTLCESGSFTTLYALAQDIREFKVELTSASSQKALLALRGKVDEVLEHLQKVEMPSASKEEKKKRRACYEIRLEILEVCKARARQAAGQNNVDIFQKSITTAEELIRVTNNELQKLKSKPLVAEVRALPPNLDDIASRADSEHDFWKKSPTFTYTSYSRRWNYQATGDLAQSMMKVGERLFHFIERLEKRLLVISQGDLAPQPGKNTLKEEVGYLIASFDVLVSTFTEYREQIYATDYDKLSPTLLNYAFALNFELKEARSRLAYLQKYIEPNRIVVFQAMGELHKLFHLLERSQSPLREQEKDKACLLLPAALALRAALFEMPPRESKKPLDVYMRTTTEVLHEIHARQDSVLLALTEDEKAVPDFIFKEGSLDGLYEEGEDKTKLPMLLMAYLAKEMMKSMYLPQDEDTFTQELTLELVCYALSHDAHLNELVVATLEQYEKLQAVFTAYEKDVQARRNMLEKSMEGAFQIVRRSLSIQSIEDYASLSQAYFEFAADCTKDRKLVTSLSDCLKKALFARLKHHLYPVYYKDVRDHSVETWKFGEFDVFSAKFAATCKDLRYVITHVTDHERECIVFESLVLKVVSGALYARRESARRLYIGELHLILKEERYRPYLDALSPDVSRLITQNTLNVINDYALSSGVSLTPFEEKLLMGPLRAFLEKEETIAQDALLDLVLQKLIYLEQKLPKDKRPITTVYREYRRKDELKSLLERVEDLIAGDGVNQIDEEGK